MNPRGLRSTLALFLPLAAVSMHAQGAFYINPAAAHVSISKADPSLYSFLGTGNTSRMFFGVGIGGYYDLPLANQQFEVGIDLRDTALHGNNALLNTFSFGPRIAGSPFNRDIHPYIEPFVGLGTTRAPNTAIKINKAQFGILVGADYNLNKRVAWRIAEVGYSSLSTVSESTVGAPSGSIPSANIISITTGLTFRLP